MSEPIQSSDPQPSAEARAQEIIDTVAAEHDGTGPCARLSVPNLRKAIADAIREREREALERAAKALDDKARQLHAVANATASACAGSHGGIDAAYQLDIESTTLRGAAAVVRALVGFVDRASRREGAK